MNLFLPTGLNFTSRQDVATPEWQYMLSQAAARKTSFVCDYCEGLDLRLFPVYLAEEQGHYVRCAPGELQRHRPECWVHTRGSLFGPTEARTAVYLASMFLPPSDIISTAGGVARTVSDRAGGRWYGDIGHLANVILTNATIATFADFNRGLSYTSPSLGMAPRDQIFDRLRESLWQPVFEDGTSPAATAKRQGLGLYWGIVAAPLGEMLHRQRVSGGTLKITLDELWDSYGIRSDAPVFEVTPLVGRYAGGRTMAYANLIPGPYIVFFASRDRQITRLMVWPVATSRNELHLLDSSPERVYFEPGAVHPAAIKLPVRADLGRLGRALWPVDTLNHPDLPHRPDVIEFRAGKIRLVEIAGSRSHDYQRIVDQRLAHYAAWSPHPDIVPEKYDAT